MVIYVCWKYIVVECEGEFGEVEKIYVIEWMDIDWWCWEKFKYKE